jgi:hypothetical protein
MLPETMRSRVGNGSIYAGKSIFLFPPALFGDEVPEEQRGPAPPKPSLIGFWRLFAYPPIGIVSFNTAILYSTYFCIAVHLPVALEQTYHWSTLAVGFGYLAVGK